MNNSKQHIAYKFVAFLVIACLVMPAMVKLSHAIHHNHDHVVCIEKDQVHFHNIEYDCEFYKFNINHSLFIEHYEYEVASNPETCTLEIAYYNYLNGHQQLTAFLRGPPQYLV